MKKIIVTSVLALGVTLGGVASAEACSAPKAPVVKVVKTKVVKPAPVSSTSSGAATSRKIDWD